LKLASGSGVRCRIREDCYEHTIDDALSLAGLRKLGGGAARSSPVGRSIHRVHAFEHDWTADADHHQGCRRKSANPERAFYAADADIAIDSANADFTVDAADHAGANQSAKRNFSKHGGPGPRHHKSSDDTHVAVRAQLVFQRLDVDLSGFDSGNDQRHSGQQPFYRSKWVAAFHRNGAVRSGTDAERKYDSSATVNGGSKERFGGALVESRPAGRGRP
jgi:hypothetical protein